MLNYFIKQKQTILKIKTENKNELTDINSNNYIKKQKQTNIKDII